ncbi:S-layer homology domain-containing protein [Ructibacterium gallinarum]|uniref:S-layer homology domain-containing protein n=1 Tax=Ructibacterium gallinarum TaxID=2779355 RepID=A0A9D5LYY8_9FIRM|nr:S-layer homology domain-containing protein [Ructibacterium gallinarum]MBE5039502.1 S-layer homology domain-containing protein [Ructibacterium gallinarum]
MKKLVISILSLAIVMQTSCLVMADEWGSVEVPADLQASNGSSVYQDAMVEIDAGDSINLKATVDMSSVREAFESYVAEAKATINEIADEETKNLLLQKLAESQISGSFEILLKYPKSLTLPTAVTGGEALYGFSSAAEKVFEEESREVVAVDSNTSALKIVIKVAGPVQDDGSRLGYCTESEVEANIDEYLPDLEFVAANIDIPQRGVYLFSGEMTGETTVKGNNTERTITYTAVQKPGNENPEDNTGISVSVEATGSSAYPVGPGTSVGGSGSKLPGTSVILPGTSTSSSSSEETDAVAFYDVNAQDWFYDGVSYVVSNGLMNGVSSNEFAPYEETTRAMICTILWRMENSPAAGATAVYGDVASDAYYASPIAWATQAGIVNGYGDGLFGPDDVITREQMAAILNRYANYKGAKAVQFADLSAYQDASSVSDWATQNMAWAVGAGLISGKENNNLDPSASAIRAEVATIFMRYCENIVQ